MFSDSGGKISAIEVNIESKKVKPKVVTKKKRKVKIFLFGICNIFIPPFFLLESILVKYLHVSELIQLND